MLGITAANLFLCLNGTMIHQKLPDEVHHDLSTLDTWGMDVTMVVVWHEEGAVQDFHPKPTSVGTITTIAIANSDKIKIKEKQGEMKEQDRKEKSFPMLFFFAPSVSKPLNLPSAIQSSDLLLFCLRFRCPLSRLISASKRRSMHTSEAL